MILLKWIDFLVENPDRECRGEYVYFYVRILNNH